MRALLLGLVFAGLAGVTEAQAVVSDGFSFSGALTSNGWTAHSGAGNKVIMANGSVATLEQSSGSGEDVNMSFTAIGATDKIYASFDLNIPSGNPVNPDTAGNYFVQFRTGGSFRARTGVLSPAGGGDYVLAINADSSDLGAGTSWASKRTLMPSRFSKAAHSERIARTSPSSVRLAGCRRRESCCTFSMMWLTRSAWVRIISVSRKSSAEISSDSANSWPA